MKAKISNAFPIEERWYPAEIEGFEGQFNTANFPRNVKSFLKVLAYHSNIREYETEDFNDNRRFCRKCEAYRNEILRFASEDSTSFDAFVLLLQWLEANGDVSQWTKQYEPNESDWKCPETIANIKLDLIIEFTQKAKKAIQIIRDNEEE